MATHRDTGIRSADMSLTQLYLANEVCRSYRLLSYQLTKAPDWPRSRQRSGRARSNGFSRCKAPLFIILLGTSYGGRRSNAVADLHD